MDEPGRAAEQLPKTVATLERGIARGWHGGAQVALANPLSGLDLRISVGTDLGGTPITDDSIFPWTCATKPIAAIMIGQLVAERALRFDEPVAEILPSFGQHGKGEVTIAQLLTHTVMWSDGSDPGRCAERVGWDETIATICASGLEPSTPPGTVAAYSVWSNWFVLGEIVRTLLGVDFRDAAQTRVLDPLAMTDSYVAMSATDIERTEGRRVPYSFRSAGSTPTALDDPLGACWPGFSGRGPMRDYARLLGGVLLARRGARPDLLDPAIAIELTSPHRSGLRDLTDGSDLAWGYGFAVDARPLGNLCHPDSFSHGSAGGTILNFADPSSGITAAIVCDGIPNGPTVVSRRVSLVKALFHDLRANAPEHLTPVPTGPLTGDLAPTR